MSRAEKEREREREREREFMRAGSAKELMCVCAWYICIHITMYTTCTYIYITSIGSSLQMFRGVDSVWTLVLNTGSMGKGPEMKKVSVRVEPGDQEYLVDALKIVAMQKAPAQ